MKSLKSGLLKTKIALQKK